MPHRAILLGLATAAAVAAAPGQAHAAVSLGFHSDRLVVEAGRPIRVQVTVAVQAAPCLPHETTCSQLVHLAPPATTPGFTACWADVPGCGFLDVTVEIQNGGGAESVFLELASPFVGSGQLTIAGVGPSNIVLPLHSIDPICDGATGDVFAGQASTVAIPVVLPSDPALGVHFAPAADSTITAVTPAAPTFEVDSVDVSLPGGAAGSRTEVLIATVAGTQLACSITVHAVAPFEVVMAPTQGISHVGVAQFVPFSVVRAPGFTGAISLTALTRRAPTGTSASIFSKNTSVILQVPANTPAGVSFTLRLVGTAGGFTDTASKPFVTAP
ncbi:MAG: hypothetical protein R3B06_00455 [Kofleriaceae bacterium]